MGTLPPRVPLGRQPRGQPPARYIAAQMRAMGLSDVAMERVPLDAWSFRGASVRANGQKYTASGFAGARGTVHARHPQGRLRGHGHIDEFEAAGDVRGKIVLVDFDGYDWWLNFPQMLAGHRGAAAVIFTHAP